jgi:hypothetical protein
LLFPYSTGELAEEEMAEMKAHMATCAVCTGRLESLRVMESCVRTTLRRPMQTPKLADTVMEVVTEQTRRPRRGWVWAWAAAGCLLVALLARFVFVASPTQTVKLPQEHRPKERTVATNKIPQAETRHADPVVSPNNRDLVAAQPDHRRAGQNIVPKAPRQQRSFHLASVREDQRKLALQSHEPARNTSGQSEPADDAPAPTEVESRKTTMTIAFGNLVVSRVRENHVSLLPPNKDAADIERPPLKTVVKRPEFSQPDGTPESRENT